jgi:hypothetical protein
MTKVIALQGSLFDTKDKICASRPSAGCRHIIDGIGVYNRVQKVTSLGRPLGPDREHTHPPRLQKDSAAYQRHPRL